MIPASLLAPLGALNCHSNRLLLDCVFCVHIHSLHYLIKNSRLGPAKNLANLLSKMEMDARNKVYVFGCGGNFQERKRALDLNNPTASVLALSPPRAENPTLPKLFWARRGVKRLIDPTHLETRHLMVRGDSPSPVIKPMVSPCRAPRPHMVAEVGLC